MKILLDSCGHYSLSLYTLKNKLLLLFASASIKNLYHSWNIFIGQRVQWTKSWNILHTKEKMFFGEPKMLFYIREKRKSCGRLRLLSHIQWTLRDFLTWRHNKIQNPVNLCGSDTNLSFYLWEHENHEKPIYNNSFVRWFSFEYLSKKSFCEHLIAYYVFSLTHIWGIHLKGRSSLRIISAIVSISVLWEMSFRRKQWTRNRPHRASYVNPQETSLCQIP